LLRGIFHKIDPRDSVETTVSKISLIVTMAGSGVSPSALRYICPVGILIVTHQEAACDAASVHFGWTIRTDILVLKVLYHPDLFF